MKFLKLTKLGHRNLIHHKKQTIFTVIVIGALFSVLVTIHFLMQGVEDFYIKQNLKIFNGATYITAQACRRDDLVAHHSQSHNQCIDNDGKIDEQCFNESAKKPAPCSTDQQQVNDLFKNRSQNYGGEIVGNVEIRNYQFSQINIYPQEIFKNNITADLSTKPQDVPAVVVTLMQAADLLGIKLEANQSSKAKVAIVDDIRSKAIGKVLNYNNQPVFVAGIVPYGASYISVARHARDARPLDMLLSKIGIYDNISDINPIFINDGSAAIKNLINNSTFYAYKAIIKFDSPSQAYDYFKQEIDHIPLSLFSEGRARKPSYMVSELMSNSFSFHISFETQRFMLSFANYVLLITAVIIIVFTFLRLISQDSRLIALYRSLGATARDVWFIYLWYVFELCLLTVLFALGVGALLALGISWHYSADFNAGATLFYAKKITDFTPFIGFNMEIIKIIGAILLSAPIVSILTLDQLSIKNVARRLKR